MKQLLKKIPFIYQSSQRIYYSLFSYIEKLGGSRVQEFRWKIRHHIRGKQWARGYRNTLSHPHRTFLVERIVSIPHLATVLEVGCNAAPNLVLLHEKLPHASLYGIDINREAIKEGKQWVHELGTNAIKLTVGRADDLSNFSNKSLDCVFTDATLMYVGPDKIRKVFKELCRVAKKCIVLFEYHADDSLPKAKQGFSYDGHWIYNYWHLATSCEGVKKITITKLPPELWQDSPGWKAYGNLIEIHI